MPERKIGERFVLDRSTFTVEKGFNCEGCFFNMGRPVCDLPEVIDIIGPCSQYLRGDKTSVIFKLIG